MPEQTLYYIQNHTGRRRCALWWKIGGGYTHNLNHALKMTAEEIAAIGLRPTDLPHPTERVEQLAERHCSMQQLKIRIGVETTTSLLEAD